MEVLVGIERVLSSSAMFDLLCFLTEATCVVCTLFISARTPNTSYKATGIAGWPAIGLSEQSVEVVNVIDASPPGVTTKAPLELLHTSGRREQVGVDEVIWCSMVGNSKKNVGNHYQAPWNLWKMLLFFFFFDHRYQQTIKPKIQCFLIKISWMAF